MIRFFLRRPVLVTLTLLLIILAGAISLKTMTVELWPPVSLNEIRIMTVFPGASPEEVERLVTTAIEDEVDDIDDVDYIRSSSMEGFSTVSVYFEDYVDDMDQKLSNVQREVSKVADLPPEAETPEIMEIDTGKIATIIFALSGGEDELDRRERVDDLSRLLEDVDGVADVSLGGDRTREFRVEYDPLRLRAYGLTPADLARIVGQRHRNIPAGTLKIGGEEIVVRAVGEPEEVEDLEGMVLFHRRGLPVRLRDVAQVVDSFDDPSTIVHLDGERCLLIRVSKERDAGTLDVTGAARDVAAEYGRAHTDLTVDVFLDEADELRNRLRELVNNGLLGMLVVVTVLTVTIGFRRGFFVALGVPVSMLICFCVMRAQGMSINFMTLYGLIIVLGILVDDAIVVVENITRCMEEGLPPRKAALKGATDIAAPVFMAVLTTMVAFAAIFLMKGALAVWMQYLAVVVLLMLAASLLDSFLLLPTHTAEFSPRQQAGGPNASGRSLRKLQALFERMARPLARRPGLALLIPLVLLLLSGVFGSMLRKDLYPADIPDRIFINFELPPGVALEQTEAVVSEVERRVMAQQYEDVVGVLGAAGFGLYFDDPRAKHFGQVIVRLRDRRDLVGTGFDVADALRELIDGIAAETIYVRLPPEGPPVGQPLEIYLTGDDYATLEPASSEVCEFLRGQQHVINVRDDRRPGNRELRITVDEEKLADGTILFSDFATALRAALGGLVAAERRVRDEDVDIVIRGNDALRHSREWLDNISVPNARGTPVLLGSVATITETRGPASNERRSRKRCITVFADTAEVKVAPTAVEMAQAVEREFADLSDRYPGVRITIGGEAADTQESFGSLIVALGAAVLIIFYLMVIQFSSLLQPLAVLAVIPTAAIGVVAGLLITGSAISVSAMVGVVALSGIVINDSLVLVDCINRVRREHPDLPLAEATIVAGKLRLRPILLTTVTTIGGLLPMSLGLAGASPAWAPLANSMIFGLLATTPCILLFQGPLVIVLDRLHNVLSRPLAYIRPGRDSRDEEI